MTHKESILETINHGAQPARILSPEEEEIHRKSPEQKRKNHNVDMCYPNEFSDQVLSHEHPKKDRLQQSSVLQEPVKIARTQKIVPPEAACRRRPKNECRTSNQFR
ncbi:hypothetical protein [Mangrovicoccus sp. HB161399]|uniref:hypothetical protein n=1 Tax=Mangrovicoccus sp. HB161399 TaxID=2720392 RepID=UPI0015543D4F|nr:hypothetical protein [Mangrovicoccus sp. HB161399]